MPLLDELRQKREVARSAATEILTRAQTEERDLTAEESTEHQDLVGEARELDDEIEKALEGQIAEARAQATREPEVETRTLGSEILKRGWNLKTQPSITIPADELVQRRTQSPVETRAQTVPAVNSWARLPGVLVPLGQDQRFLFPRLNTQSTGESTTVLDWKQSVRTLTGTVARTLNAVTAKATLDTTTAAVVEDLQQFAVVLPTIPNQILESIPAFTDFMNSEGAFQIAKAIDTHILAQIVASTPLFSNTGTTLIDKIRTQIGTMRGSGANPTILVLNPTDATSLDLLADAGGYVFATRATGTSSPIYGTTVVERIGGGSDPIYLIDPDMLGVLYMGSMRFDADPYTGFSTNTTNLRVEVNALFHVRNSQGAYRIAAT
jgi:Phage capsid family